MPLWRRSTPQQVGETKRVARLRDQIAEATRLRGLVRNPDLQAVEMERQRRFTLVSLWFFLSLGLMFTTTGVQRFLAGDATSADPVWWAAWTVEPMFAGLLVTLLNFEAVILAHGIDPDHDWWQRLKHVLLASTLAMNVIPQITPLLRRQWAEFNVGSLAVHAIIPVIVYGLAEVIPVIQARTRQVILHGYETADEAEYAQPEQDQPDTETALEPRTVPQESPASEPAESSETAAKQEQPVVRAVRRAPQLPPELMAAIKQARERALADGREFTAADIRGVARVPDSLAQQIAADYATNNGHAFT